MMGMISSKRMKRMMIVMRMIVRRTIMRVIMIMMMRMKMVLIRMKIAELLKARDPGENLPGTFT